MVKWKNLHKPQHPKAAAVNSSHCIPLEYTLSPG